MYVGLGGPKGYEVVTIREDSHLPGTKKKKTSIIRRVGKLSDLLAEDPDFMQKLKAQVREETLALKEAEKPITLSLPNGTISVPSDVTASYSFGHAIVSRLWQILGLDEFMVKQSGKRNADAVKNAVYYLVAHRCSSPDSIRASVLEQERFAGITPVGLDVFYSVLDVLSEQKEALVEHLCSFFRRRTTRKEDIACYDVTTYAFESTRWGEMRLFGFSKDHKNNEVQVVMGLLIDNNGIPITYELFSGNTMDQNTLVDSVSRLKEIYGLAGITVVADRGMNANDNLLFLHGGGYHFVISYTLKRSRQEFKDAVFGDDTPWAVEQYDGKTGQLAYASKILRQTVSAKVELTPEEVVVLKEQRKLEKKRGRCPKYRQEQIEANVHITYSLKRADKDLGDRNRMLERLKSKLETPGKLKAALMRGSNQYLQMDLDTDEAILDEAKIMNAAKYDGYYAVVTDRMELTTEEVMAIYRGQWKIEESFRVLKTDLQARPVFVWTDNHIKGHFAMCYLSLCIMRYLQYLMEENGWLVILSAEEIMKAIFEPLVLLQGEYPKMVVTPTCVNQAYLDISKMLKLPDLKQNMTLTQFRASTKLDLRANIQK
ncbi:MAG: IS1634 family transposase [Bacilli bacterium]|nr:IS1634 family transposase [Sphaerochaeta sp.]MDD2493536.1 IS1634 family transposase [Bacilli bacterium]